MLKTLFIAPFAALLVAGAAHAAPLQTLTLRTEQQVKEKGLRAEIVEVQTRRSAGAIIATDALYGGIAGLAIGAGVALIQNDGNWARDLTLGAGVGLLVGGLLGALDAASMGALADRASRDRGLSRSAGLGGHF
jgi:hypothetical protein